MTQMAPDDNQSVQSFVLIDGPSIDVTLGNILGRPPTAEVRPNWLLLEPWVRQEFGIGFYTAWFATLAPGAPQFINFLESAGFRPLFGERHVPMQGCADKIAEQISSLQVADGAWNLVIFTQQESLIDQLPQLAQQMPGSGRVAVCGFSEFLPDDPQLEAVIDFFDIEDDARLFRVPLPRDGFEDGEEQRPVIGPASPIEPRLFPEREAVPDASDSANVASAGRAARVISPKVRSTAKAPSLATPDASKQSPGEGEAPADARPCYLLIDGHNIDQELGQILGEKPSPNTRPDWSLVLEYVRAQSRDASGAVKADFAHIAPGHAGFRRAITELGFRSLPVKQDENMPNRAVVEEFVCNALSAKTLRGEGANGLPAHDLFVVGHSPNVFHALEAIPKNGQRIYVLGFPERMPIVDFPGIERIDIEHETGAFASTLPRQSGYDVDNFDPDDLFE